uniref:Uncharacterized protein n=1 Tax=Heterorhabditis bacteriophora TaxID=37862 RepID=A0A1I7WEW9_HETBA
MPYKCNIFPEISFHHFFLSE